MTSKISTLLAAASLALAPAKSPAAISPPYPPSTQKNSYPSSTRAMSHRLAVYSRSIDAPLPRSEAADQIVGIYGNILYPQDQERQLQKSLTDWIRAFFEHLNPAFPLSVEELNGLSFYVLERFPAQVMRHFFAERVDQHLTEGLSLEESLQQAKQETLAQVLMYQEIVKHIPKEGHGEKLIQTLSAYTNQAESNIDRDSKAIRDNPECVRQLLLNTEPSLIEPPFDWKTRTQVFKQMVDKVSALSPNSPYFLALQEVTPQALHDLKDTLKSRNLQWISMNNLSGQKTLAPNQENVPGEATGFTSTLALSPDLKILKIELGDLPTESGSVRKILGVRAQNIHTGEIFNLFTTHTDHKIQNDIYERTAIKIHDFATKFFQDDPANARFVLGGDLNAFAQLGGPQYVAKLRELFTNSQDFRETDYYAPLPIAESTFIGRPDDAFAARVDQGRLEPSALDQLLVGNGVRLHAAGREAAIYSDEGRLLDYYTEPDEYMRQLQKRIAFSDHFFNIVRFN